MNHLGHIRRADFCFDENIVMLNHGSFGAAVKPALEAQAAWRTRMERNAPDFFRNVLPKALAEARAALAAYLNAAPEEVGFIDNATAGVNAVLRSFPLAPGDEVVSTSHCYNAVRNAIRFVCRRAGARYVEVPVPFAAAEAADLLARLEAGMGPRCRLLVVDHIASEGALVFPLEAIAALCRARGVRLLIDGAHGPGHAPLDLGALGADYYAGNCHKWLCAPKGTAFLWVRPERQAGVHPLVISHFLDQGFAAEFGWQATRDPGAWLAVKEALAWRAELGAESVQRYASALTARAVALLERDWGVKAATPPAMRLFMATLPLPGDPPPERALAERLRGALLAADALETQLIAVEGRLWVRITSFVYNAEEDYARLAEALPKRLAELLR
jgi:isopenicillin-N epimerase